MLKLTCNDLHNAHELAKQIHQLEWALDSEVGDDYPQKSLALSGCSVPIPDAVLKTAIRNRIDACQKLLNEMGIELQMPKHEAFSRKA